jgi:hypothetical protein
MVNALLASARAYRNRSKSATGRPAARKDQAKGGYQVVAGKRGSEGCLEKIAKRHSSLPVRAIAPC